MAKNDIVKNSEYGKAGHALTYIGAYNCKLRELVEAQGANWFRDEKTRRLRRVDIRDDLANTDREERDILLDIASKYGVNQNNVPCLLIPKFKKNVFGLSPTEAIPVIIELLEGLCVPRDFIINDLHMSNMAVMPDDRAVTFDYDMLRTRGDNFKRFLTDILQDTPRYLTLPQYQHVMKLGPKTIQEYASSRRPRATETLFVNHDLLSVLTSLRLICSALGAPTSAAAVNKCMNDLATLAPDDSAGRLLAVGTLKEEESLREAKNAARRETVKDLRERAEWVETGGEARGEEPPKILDVATLINEAKTVDDQRVLDAMAAEQAVVDGIVLAWDTWKQEQAKAEVARERQPRGPSTTPYGPQGGRRTFRRKGLPQLL
jgi:hypothetical protein